MCSRPGCTTHALPERVNGVWADPPGWSNVTITGQPIINHLLCPSCTDEVRALLAASRGELERRRDGDLAQAFDRGYAKGQEDTLELTGTGTVDEVPA
jgi:hypothetical protein